MIKGVGIDIVNIDRIQRVFRRFPERFLNRILTITEQKQVMSRHNPIPALAARFAGKEAVVKALGSGIGVVSWHDVEFLQVKDGPPKVVLNGGARRWAKAHRVNGLKISWSHEKDYAVAYAVAYRKLMLNKKIKN